jgi:hypothetical protein
MRAVTGLVAKGSLTMSGTVPSATIPFHELCAAASYCFPQEVQERFALLQAKNNEGTLTEAEAKELQTLINEYNTRTIEKAKALLELQRRGAEAGKNRGCER